MVKDEITITVLVSITIAGTFTLTACGMIGQSASSQPPSTIETRVIRFSPQVPSEERDGVCRRHSTATPYAWRCNAESSRIYDPCYIAVDETTVVCGVHPMGDEPGFRLSLTEPLPSDAGMPADDPWPHGSVVELEDGTVCDMKAGGTSLVFRDERVNYWCGEWDSEGENVGILGDLQVGTVWAAERIVIELAEEGWVIAESDVVPIRVVWQ